MANGKIRFGKQSGGELALIIPDGVDNTEVIFPEIGTLTTKEYVDSTAVKLTGNQTIEDIKTFISSPIVPTPTANTQAANKAYVDSASGGAWSANDTRAKTALNASGEAPIYACRAWVNFNGQGTVAIRASGNVSSITDNGVGNYTVNFTTTMPDSNYTVFGNTVRSIGFSAATPARVCTPHTLLSTSVIVPTFYIGDTLVVLEDTEHISVSIFR